MEHAYAKELEMTDFWEAVFKKSEFLAHWSKDSQTYEDYYWEDVGN